MADSTLNQLLTQMQDTSYYGLTPRYDSEGGFLGFFNEDGIRVNIEQNEDTWDSARRGAVQSGLGNIIKNPLTGSESDAWINTSEATGYDFTDPKYAPFLQNNEGQQYISTNDFSRLNQDEFALSGLSQFFNSIPQLAAMGIVGGGALGAFDPYSLSAAGAGGTGATGLVGAGTLASETGFVPGSFELGASSLAPTAAGGLDAAATLAGTAGVGTSLGAGATGLTEFGAPLASEAGFVPGSFEIGQSALGTTAAGGLDAAAALAGATGAGGAGILETMKNALTKSMQDGSNTTFGIPNNILQGILQGGLGMLGADVQSDAYQDVANQNLSLGAPYRGLLQQSYGQDFNLMNQPGYGDAFDRAADISARSWSAKAGNPAGNPTAQAGILSDVWNQSYLPALSNYRGGLMQAGGMGLNTSGAAQMGGAQTAGGAYDALGYGIGTAMQQQPDWAKIFQGAGGNQNPYALNIGGIKWGGR